NDDPRAGEGDADVEPVALVARVRRRADAEGDDRERGEREQEPSPHSDGILRNQSSENSPARNVSTPPAAANAKVISCWSRSLPSRDPSCSYTRLSRAWSGAA